MRVAVHMHTEGNHPRAHGKGAATSGKRTRGGEGGGYGGGVDAGGDGGELVLPAAHRRVSMGSCCGREAGHA